ncbi:MAG: GntR family transcriptional regulator, partial [Bacteroidia bacterium]|nr:GntR family transcriptional regulator [Bacteroidia bacterium]
MLKKNIKPSSRDIAIALEGLIRERGLEQGTKLSTSVQLAEKFGVSVKTVHRAVERLVAKGLVFRIRGSGTYVAENKQEASKLNVGLFLWKQQSGVTLLDQVAFDGYAEDLVSDMRKQGHRVEVFMEGISQKWTCHVKTMQLEKFDVVVAAAGIL